MLRRNTGMAVALPPGVQSSGGCRSILPVWRTLAEQASSPGSVDVPEQREAIQNAGDVLAVGGRAQQLAKRDVGNILQRLQLDSLGDPALSARSVRPARRCATRAATRIAAKAAPASAPTATNRRLLADLVRQQPGLMDLASFDPARHPAVPGGALASLR
jgi:hypothetical protein